MHKLYAFFARKRETPAERRAKGDGSFSDGSFNVFVIKSELSFRDKRLVDTEYFAHGVSKLRVVEDFFLECVAAEAVEHISAERNACARHLADSEDYILIEDRRGGVLAPEGDRLKIAFDPQLFRKRDNVTS